MPSPPLAWAASLSCSVAAAQGPECSWIYTAQEEGACRFCSGDRDEACCDSSAVSGLSALRLFLTGPQCQQLQGPGSHVSHMGPSVCDLASNLGEGGSHASA